MNDKGRQPLTQWNLRDDKAKEEIIQAYDKLGLPRIEALLAYMIGYQTLNADLWRSAFATDGKYIDFSTPDTGISGDGLTKHIKQLKAAMPDSGFDVYNAFVSTDRKVAGIQYIWRGTYNGNLPGTKQRVPNKVIYVPGVDICEFNEEGKLKLVTGYLDKFAFLQQIGLIPRLPQPQKAAL